MPQQVERNAGRLNRGFVGVVVAASVGWFVWRGFDSFSLLAFMCIFGPLFGLPMLSVWGAETTKEYMTLAFVYLPAGWLLIGGVLLAALWNIQGPHYLGGWVVMGPVLLVAAAGWVVVWARKFGD